MPKVQLMTQAAYARHRGVTRNAVGRAITDGRISLIDGRIDPAIADAQWQANTRPRSDARSQGNTQAGNTPDAFGTARARREHAEAAMAELQLAEKMGKLIERTGVEMAIATGFGQLRDRVMATPDRLPCDKKTRDMLTAALTDVFNDVIKDLEQITYDESTRTPQPEC